MSISVIIPMYNVADYVEECLDSLLGNITNFEVLLIDDGSTDQTGDIALKYAKKYPSVFYYYRKENGGLSDARNFGMKYAKKEYVFFVDSDDFLEKQAIDILNRELESKDIDLIIFNMKSFYSNNNILVNTIIHGDSRFIEPKEYLLTIPAAWNKIIKRSLIEENDFEFPKGLWYEDLASTASYINYSSNIYYLNNTLYYYRVRQNSITNQKKYNPKMIDIRKSLYLMKESIDCKKYKDEIEFRFIYHMIFHQSIRLLEVRQKQDIKHNVSFLLKTYPQWNKNIYYKRKSVYFKLFCYLIVKRCYFVCNVLLKLKASRI